MTPTQQLVVDRLRAGHTLMWSPHGPEMSGYPFRPQKRTVRAMMRDGVLKRGEANNKTQDECGMYPIVLANKVT